jgi:internalin A
MKKIGILFLCFVLIFTLTACQKAPATEAVSTENSSAETEVIATESATEAVQTAVVTFKDEGLEKYIRENLQKPSGDILVSDMETLSSIDLRDNIAYDLSGLEYAKNIYSATISDCTVKSITPLAKIEGLPYLNIAYSVVEEVPDRVNWKAMHTFSVIDSSIPNINFLSSVTSLNSFTHVSSKLSSLEPIVNNRDLASVDFSSSLVKDISPLKGMDKIDYLDFAQSQVASLETLETLTNLSVIDLSYNKITNLEPLLKLTNLTAITAWDDPDKNKWLLDRTQLKTLEGKGIEVEYYGK